MNLITKLVGEDFTLVRDGERFYRTLEHSSLVIDDKHNRFYWNSRNLYGGCLEYLKLVRDFSDSDAKKILKESNFSFFDAAVTEDETEPIKIETSLVDVFFNTGKYFRDYWYNKRGYTDKTIENFKLGFTGFWYTIPIFDGGKFVNFQIRRDNPKLIKHWYKGVGPHPFNFSNLLFTNWVVITEGPPDAIMLRQNDIPAISQTGGSSYWNKDWNIFFNGIKKIYIVYDNDDAGRTYAKKLGSVFGKKALIYTFDGFEDKFDVTDYFKLGNSKDDFITLLETKGKHEYEL